MVSWMRESFVEDDFVIVKMDIEGAERNIIPKLLATNASRLIDVLLWECHLKWRGQQVWRNEILVIIMWPFRLTSTAFLCRVSANALRGRSNYGLLVGFGKSFTSHIHSQVLRKHEARRGSHHRRAHRAIWQPHAFLVCLLCSSAS